MSVSKGGHVTVARRVVRFLRSGAKRELDASMEIIAAEIAADANLRPEAYYGGLARFDDARALLEVIGVSDQLEPQDVELDLARWPRLVLEALECQLDLELIRLEGAHADGIDLIPRDLRALGCLVADIRGKVGAPAKPEREQGRLERQLALRTPRRRRGDG
jgi:hypothetical protein